MIICWCTDRLLLVAWTCWVSWCDATWSGWHLRCCCPSTPFSASTLVSVFRISLILSHCCLISPFHSTLSLVLLLWICKLLHSLCFSVILLFIFLPCPEPQVWEKAITTEILLRTTFNINVSTLYKNTDEYTWSSEWLKIQWNNNYLL